MGTTNGYRNQRVRDYLKSVYGEEPWPLRSYITQEEAKALTNAHSMGRAVFSDMNTRGFGCRHRDAVENSIREGLDPGKWTFWHKARINFLEIGGCYDENGYPSFMGAVE